MHGLVVLDDNDDVIRPAILWNDGRTQIQTEYLNNEIGKEILSERTANIAFAGFNAPKLLWMKESEPELFAKIAKIMLPKDYINYKLTGIHCTDYSDAGGMLLLDVEHKCWSAPMLKICGITEPLLQSLPAADVIRDHCFGGMPVELGWCCGHNRALNCLEYHRDSEFNLGTEEFILLLARQDEITDGFLDTAKVKAFLVPAGTLVEVYATTLHYAPCCTDNTDSFRVLVALPWGTNTDMPQDFAAKTPEDSLLWARNKWLLAHAESDEAAQGACVRLTGQNLSI